jgi:hypothetical protein
MGVEDGEKDSDGMSPLPPYLAAATVRFGRKEEEDCDEETGRKRVLRNRSLKMRRLGSCHE